LQAQSAELKTKALEQTKGLLAKFNQQFQLNAKLTKLNETVGKDALWHLFQNKVQRVIQAKLAQVKEDLQEIQTRGQDILNTSLRNSLEKKKQSK
jgi:RNAse (barnase) inhibitor barstar